MMRGLVSPLRFFCHLPIQVSLPRSLYLHAWLEEEVCGVATAMAVPH